MRVLTLVALSQARRNAVKEENRAKRAVKMKKADKAKKVKKTSGKK
jgi:hypothetical protein